MERKLAGRKSDLIFVRQKLEVGCGQLGRVDNREKASKEMVDSRLKTPKRMEDVLLMLILQCPHQIRRRRTVGFIAMGG